MSCCDSCCSSSFAVCTSSGAVISSHSASMCAVASLVAQSFICSMLLFCTLSVITASPVMNEVAIFFASSLSRITPTFAMASANHCIICSLSYSVTLTLSYTPNFAPIYSELLHTSVNTSSNFTVIVFIRLSV